MLSKLILLALQAIVAWVAAPPIVRYIPGLGGLQYLVYAVIFAVLVWVVGLVLSQVLREAGMPSSATLVAALILALVRRSSRGCPPSCLTCEAPCARSPTSPIR